MSGSYEWGLTWRPYEMEEYPHTPYKLTEERKKALLEALEKASKCEPMWRRAK